MSYIEEKYKAEIETIFEELASQENSLLKILRKKSLEEVDEVAKRLSEVNKKINLILRKFYPEIKDMDDKLEIKSTLKFYYDLLDALTDYVRNVERFRKIDDQYYDHLVDFIQDKERLISGKYRQICTDELTAFYDEQSRAHLEQILEKKFAARQKGFFAMGPWEEELKKIGKVAGADEVSIFSAEELVGDTDLIAHPKAAINYSILAEEPEKLERIGKELKDFLTSKGHKAAILTVELPDLEGERVALTGTVVTDAELVPD